MFPTLKSGQTFVGLKTKKIGVGDVVIVKANGSVDMVKRVTSIEGEKITVSGDNKNLESSLCFMSYKKKRCGSENAILPSEDQKQALS